MTAFLDPALTTIALCWRIARGDGVALGFTTHDRDLTIDGLDYRATPGIAPSAIALSDGFEVDTLDVAGALTADAITADDLMAGRWDGADVRLFAIDWTDPAGERLALARGRLGAVSQTDLGFTAELRGPTAQLERAVVETTSPDCRAELGDRRCRVDMAGRVRIARVIALESETLVIDRSEPVAGVYACGRLRWIDGRASGIAEPIAASDGDRILLRTLPPADAVGARIEISEGCDKLIGTCAARFGNAANFRGEPHLPGNDLLTRYPS
ncbi:DUF2163 domain-containing protein [Sphingomonas sp. 1P06PA]|uniref:DUF2163 domain-containing protein n=1 Tax=Sphingomonas sp. 1P06PA TaxID=554121 RepID=UPI0039A5EB3B